MRQVQPSGCPLLETVKHLDHLGVNQRQHSGTRQKNHAAEAGTIAAGHKHTRGKTMTYASFTYEDPNPIKSWIQRHRLRAAAQMVDLADKSVLDYGCGDGRLFQELTAHNPRVMHGYDPSTSMIREANAYGMPNTLFSTNFEDFDGNRYDVVFCMEVCEHLTDESLFELVQNIYGVTHAESTLVLGVPIESGLPSLGKNIFRLIRRQPQATVHRTILALLGLHITRAPSPRGWIGTHIGFNWRHVYDMLPYLGFRPVATSCLPVPALGRWLNNEIYFVCEKADRR